jgi:multidrug efflux pump subunit AcrB
MLPFWKFFIERRQFTMLLIAALVIWGFVSILSITKESAPEVQIPVGIVSVVLPGSSAEDVERLVTDKIEERLANLQNLNKLTSTSRDGVSVVTVEFTASADLDKSIQKLRDEVAKVRPDLPTDATDPSVSDVNFVDQPIQIISITADLPFAKFAELGDHLKDELQGVKGVSRVQISGVRNREVQVVVKKEQLSRYGVGLNEVIAAISASNASLPVGSINVDNVNYSLNFKGDLDEVPDLGSIPLVGPHGQTIYLRDIATVSDGVEKASSYSRVSVAGQPSQQAMSLYVYKVRGQNVGAVTTAVKAKLDGLKQSMLQGSDVLITYDLGDQINKDLSTLSETGVETVILVMLCLFATLGWRESLVAGLSIPLSFFIAFIGLLYSGNTINFVSLFSLILAIGILVDSGIVVVEAIHTRYRATGDKKKAALLALQDYAWPLIGGTAATIAFFVPLFFISGIVGKFIASIPFTIIFVLIASIFVALGLVPLLAMMFIKDGHHEESKLMQRQEEYTLKAQTWYGNFLAGILKDRRFQNRFMIGMAAAFFISLSLPVVGLVKVNFFPADNVDFIFVNIEKPQGTTLPLTDLSAREVEEKLYDDPEIESLITTVGGSSAFSNTPENGEKFANITINLKKEREHTSGEMVDIVKRKLVDVKSAQIVVAEQAGGPPVGAPILIKFTGPNRDALSGAVDQARDVLASVPGVIDIDASNKNDSTEFTLSINRAKLADVGLTPAAVAQTLRAAVSGVTATKLTAGTRDVDVVVSLNLNPNFKDPHDAVNTSIDAIGQIPVKTAKGSFILLGSVLDTDIGRSNSVITHEARERLVTLSANVGTGYNSREAIAEFTKRMEGSTLPEGVTYSIGGENEETNKSFAEMGLALFAGLALSFVILVLSFNSFRYSAYLGLMIFLSFIGVFGGLALSRQDLSFSSLLGIIALAGVIINHAIILVDSIIQRMKSHKEMPLDRLIIDAATSRLRPIVLTTLTTALGMIPLTFVSALWGPLAFAVMFGLTFAMVLTLIMIPILVYRWPGNTDRFRE